MRRGKLLISLIVSLAVLITSLPTAGYASSGRAYYVSSEYGSDTNNGTSIMTPFKSLKKAVSVAQPGDTVFIRGGRYKEKLIITKSGNPNAYITFQNYNGEKVIIDGAGMTLSDDDYSNGLILIRDKSYIKIIGLDVTGYVSNDHRVPSGIMITGNSKNIEIRNCKVYGIATTYPTKGFTEDRNAHAIAVYGTNNKASIDGLIIDGCEVYNNILGQSETITLNGNVTNFRITNNKVHDNDNIGICIIGYEGIAHSNDSARSGIISDNQVWNISSSKNKTYKDNCADGIYVDGGTDVEILRNWVYNCDIGIEAACETQNKYTDRVTIANNIVYNCSLAGISIGGAEANNGGSKNIIITNNTLYNNNIGIYYQYNCQFDTNVVSNNIIYNCKNTTYGSTVHIVFKNNIVKDPQFVAPGSDFHLKKGSVAIDAGVYSSASGTVDFDGNPRLVGAEVDCGAYEYQEEAAVVTPPDTTTASNMKVLVPAYFYSADLWARLAAQSKKNPGMIYAIANLANGPGSSKNADYVKYINNLKANGGKVIGYVYTNYGSIAEAQVKADIDKWYSWYDIDGIFLDCQAYSTGFEAYYSRIYAYIKGKDSSALVVGNPGVNTIESYLVYNGKTVTDAVCIFETDNGFSTWTPSSWCSKYNSDRFYVLPYNISSNEWKAVVDRAALLNIGWIYCTDDTGVNPWDTLPSYFEAMCDYIAVYSKPDPEQEPVPEPTPEPVPEPTPEPIPEPTPEPVLPVEPEPAKINIIVDGDASDWALISPVISSSSGVAHEIKLYNDDTYLYICVTGSNLTKYPNVELMINTDGKESTGYKYYNWKNSGCEYTLENDELYKYTGKGNDWKWKYLKQIRIIKTADCIEYRVALSDLGLRSGSIITVGYIGMDKNWNEREWLPEGGKLPQYILK